MHAEISCWWSDHEPPQPLLGKQRHFGNQDSLDQLRSSACVAKSVATQFPPQECNELLKAWKMLGTARQLGGHGAITILVTAVTSIMLNTAPSSIDILVIARIQHRYHLWIGAVYRHH